MKLAKANDVGFADDVGLADASFNERRIKNEIS